MKACGWDMLILRNFMVGVHYDFLVKMLRNCYKSLERLVFKMFGN